MVRQEKILGELNLKLKNEELRIKNLDLEKKGDELEISRLENELKQASLLKEKANKRIWIIILVLTTALGGFTVFFLFNRRKNIHKLELAQWELNTLRNQMKPHFIFNVLNSINHFVRNKEPQIASVFLVQFSKLIRQTLNNAAAEMISLNEEMEAAKTLIELEKINISHQLSYEFEIQEGLDPEDVKVPSLILQPFIENAIWHGIAPKKDAGKIIVRIRAVQNNLLIEIEDNGVGRNQSIHNTSRHNNQSFGLKITEEHLQLLSKTHRKKFAFHFEDLNPGLKVIIQMPFLKDFQ